MTNDDVAPTLGPIGRNVARNVASLRKARNLTLRGLSAQLGTIGRPMQMQALHTLGRGKRRVDADDLMALAVALGVNPSALLLPRDASTGGPVELTARVHAPAWAAWAWADGRRPLPAESGGSTGADFSRDARPWFACYPGTLFEFYELADRFEAWSAAADPVTRNALRDRLLLQVRMVMHRLEEELAEENVTGQLRDAASRVPTPAPDGSRSRTTIRAQIAQAVRAGAAPARIAQLRHDLRVARAEKLLRELLPSLADHERECLVAVLRAEITAVA